MIRDIDIWRAANLYIKQHGEEAASRAEFMALGFGAMGDFDGREVWYRIIEAIRWMQEHPGKDLLTMRH